MFTSLIGPDSSTNHGGRKPGFPAHKNAVSYELSLSHKNRPKWRNRSITFTTWPFVSKIQKLHLKPAN